MGFEPTVPLSITGFQDQLLKPLGHLSKFYGDPSEIRTPKTLYIKSQVLDPLELMSHIIYMAGDAGLEPTHA